MKKITYLFLLASLSISTSLVACGKEQPSGTSSGLKVGVAECDEYIAKLEQCLGTLPAASKPMVQSALDQSVTAWKKQLEENPAAKEATGMACKQALEMAKQSYAPMGCKF